MVAQFGAIVTTINKFLGIVNTSDEAKQKLGALSVAENVLITESGTVLRRKGNVLTSSATKITGSYATTDNVAMFLIDSGSLFHFDGVAFNLLINGLPDSTSYWCEETPNRVFIISGEAYLYIDNNEDITQLHTLGLPFGELNDLAANVELFPQLGVSAMTYHQGSVILAVNLNDGLSRVQFSIPQAYHLFHKINNRFEIADDVLALESVNGQLLICCRHSIYSYTSDSRLLKLADYGVVPGKSVTKLPDNGCLISTTRGIAKYPEFENLTEKMVSFPPGNGSASSLYEVNGNKFLLVCTDGGGISFNNV